jgi:hypothetical protein
MTGLSLLALSWLAGQDTAPGEAGQLDWWVKEL